MLSKFTIEVRSSIAYSLNVLYENVYFMTLKKQSLTSVFFFYRIRQMSKTGKKARFCGVIFNDVFLCSPNKLWNLFDSFVFP